MIDYIEHIVSLVITALFGAVTWLIRTVLTNQKKIELLESEIRNRDKTRKEDRETMLDLKADLKAGMEFTRDDINRIREDIVDLWKKQ